MGIVMGRRMSQRRALRRIERDLVRSDPRLNALSTELTGLGGDKEMPVTEQISTGPHWLPARLGRRARFPDGRGLASPADDSLTARQSIRLRHDCALRWLCPFQGVRSTRAARFGVLGTVGVPAAVAASREGNVNCNLSVGKELRRLQSTPPRSPSLTSPSSLGPRPP